ncbi:MAG UNVERIFIED_CONTAM: hypothetical protein LVR18_00875 [Planctomycetaceae bacterium]
MLADRPSERLDSSAPAGSSATVRRERIQQLRQRIREQQSATESLAGELQRLLDEGPLPLAFAMSEGTPRTLEFTCVVNQLSPANWYLADSSDCPVTPRPRGRRGQWQA